MKFSRPLPVFALCAIIIAPRAHAAACKASQLSLATDNENGNFNGMSHSGTLLVLRNLGPTACTVAGLPQLLFSDSSNAALPITRAVSRGMHPGPVIRPVTIVPEAELTSRLTWVSGEVYDHSQCFTPTTLNAAIGNEKLTTPVSAHICGPAGKVTFSMTELVPDPTLPPQKQ